MKIGPLKCQICTNAQVLLNLRQNIEIIYKYLINNEYKNKFNRFQLFMPQRNFVILSKSKCRTKNPKNLCFSYCNSSFCKCMSKPIFLLKKDLSKLVLL